MVIITQLDWSNSFTKSVLITEVHRFRDLRVASSSWKQVRSPSPFPPHRPPPHTPPRHRPGRSNAASNAASAVSTSWSTTAGGGVAAATPLPPKMPLCVDPGPTTTALPVPDRSTDGKVNVLPEPVPDPPAEGCAGGLAMAGAGEGDWPSFLQPGSTSSHGLNPFPLQHTSRVHPVSMLHTMVSNRSFTLSPPSVQMSAWSRGRASLHRRIRGRGPGAEGVPGAGLFATTPSSAGDGDRCAPTGDGDRCALAGDGVTPLKREQHSTFVHLLAAHRKSSMSAFAIHSSGETSMSTHKQTRGNAAPHFWRAGTDGDGDRRPAGVGAGDVGGVGVPGDGEVASVDSAGDGDSLDAAWQQSSSVQPCSLLHWIVSTVVLGTRPLRVHIARWWLLQRVPFAGRMVVAAVAVVVGVDVVTAAFVVVGVEVVAAVVVVKGVDVVTIVGVVVFVAGEVVVVGVWGTGDGVRFGLAGDGDRPIGAGDGDRRGGLLQHTRSLHPVSWLKSCCVLGNVREGNLMHLMCSGDGRTKRPFETHVPT